ncbi:MAG: RNA polymerase sigma-54 factor [Candidatus Latescibacteria bacterium 4484_7]|nr:MAG: RNA polymerase sigma-54 factor [Candidatus Latescibacteria bacterium 4484_7]RKZ07491.1 MAG: RNA polymerase sigma-54 factor [bacterium]
MEMKIGLNVGLQQRIIMTPKLQQALKLLQMPTLELQQVLKQEILQNPLLEEVEDGDEVNEEETESEEEEAEAESEEKKDEEEASDVDWDDYFETGFGIGSGYAEEEEREDFLERVPVARQTLSEYLLSQLRIITDDKRTLEIGEYIIGSLDDSGYLTCPLKEIADTFGITEEEVEKVLKIIQTLDPPGVGARNLKECLMIQIKARGMENTLAAKIIRDHFDEFKQKKYLDLSKKLKVSLKELQEQAKIIGTLDPKPGLDIVSEEPRYVIPDLIVERVGDKYVVSLNDKNIPRLRISQSYKNELTNNASISEETKEFIQTRLKNARWLIQTIEQRRRTMVKVMEAIVEEQREFFEKGTAFLKPLTLQQIAIKIKMHESTVSRVTTNKYVQTPRGVYELKFFFSSKLDTHSGEEVSAKSAKMKIKEIIAKEDPRKPLSDQKIADILKRDGLIIARRTVAKYREQLGILPARHRKQY